MDGFTVTRRWLKQWRTPRGGYRAAQLKALGLPWPGPKGWPRMMAGQVITQTQRETFERESRTWRQVTRARQEPSGIGVSWHRDPVLVHLERRAMRRRDRPAAGLGVSTEPRLVSPSCLAWFCDEDGACHHCHMPSGHAGDHRTREVVWANGSSQKQAG